MTYAESVGKGPFNWLMALKRAQNTKTPIKQSTWDRWLPLATAWPTCACGNQCSIIPRDLVGESHGIPKDNALAELGHNFYHYIRHKDVNGALGTCLAIEKRADEIIQEIHRSAQ